MASSRVDLMVDNLKTVGMVALPSDISVGITPDQGKRIRYEATVVAEMTESVPPRLHAILDGKPEGIIQFHELPGIGSIGDPSRGDLMAGFTKAPFYGAAYKKRGLVKGIALHVTCVYPATCGVRLRAPAGYRDGHCAVDGAVQLARDCCT